MFLEGWKDLGRCLDASLCVFVHWAFCNYQCGSVLFGLISIPIVSCEVPFGGLIFFVCPCSFSYLFIFLTVLKKN